MDLGNGWREADSDALNGSLDRRALSKTHEHAAKRLGVQSDFGSGHSFHRGLTS
jgi:hypothetical protein